MSTRLMYLEMIALVISLIILAGLVMNYIAYYLDKKEHKYGKSNNKRNAIVSDGSVSRSHEMASESSKDANKTGSGNIQKDEREMGRTK